jgi:DNA-binding transcriptional regulator YiaG
VDIKAIRKELGLSKSEFARRVGVSFITVSRWERGISEPSPMAKVNIEKLMKEVK